MIGPFTFVWSKEEENDDFTMYDITHDNISIPFQILTIDTSKECGPR